MPSMATRLVVGAWTLVNTTATKHGSLDTDKTCRVVAGVRPSFETPTTRVRRRFLSVPRSQLVATGRSGRWDVSVSERGSRVGGPD